MMHITENGTVHERLSALIDYFCKGNKTAFGRETDILPGVLASITGGRLSKPSFELLQKIMIRYPTVNGDWLILGRGPMLRQGNPTAASQRAPVTISEFVAEYEQHKANHSDMEAILRSKYDLRQRILSLVEDASQGKELLKLGALEASYEELLASRRNELKGAAYSALHTPTEPYVTREQFEQTMQVIANLEHVIESLIDMSPPDVAARIRQNAAEELANKQQKG